MRIKITLWRVLIKLSEWLATRWPVRSDREDRCFCQCHQATLGTARAAMHMQNQVKSDKWFRRRTMEGWISVEHIDELDAFFACVQCLPLHCRALSGRPAPLWNPKPLEPYAPPPSTEEDDAN